MKRKKISSAIVVDGEQHVPHQVCTSVPLYLRVTWPSSFLFPSPVLLTKYLRLTWPSFVVCLTRLAMYGIALHVAVCVHAHHMVVFAHAHHMTAYVHARHVAIFVHARQGAGDLR